jgi:hypothetical protein
MKIFFFLFLSFTFSSCFYKFNDKSVDPNLKTFKVAYIENKARYVNPQLSPKLTDKLRQKIISQTKLNATNSDADLEIIAVVNEYSVTTSGVSNGSTATTNRLNVGLSLEIKNNKDPNKNIETTITRNFDFGANQTLPQAESRLNEEIVKTVVDEIFARIFSNW